eukprot:1160068-Pelagomonas_calceolata.AAC.5
MAVHLLYSDEFARYSKDALKFHDGNGMFYQSTGFMWEGIQPEKLIHNIMHYFSHQIGEPERQKVDLWAECCKELGMDEKAEHIDGISKAIQKPLRQSGMHSSMTGVIDTLKGALMTKASDFDAYDMLLHLGFWTRAP